MRTGKNSIKYEYVDGKLRLEDRQEPYTGYTIQYIYGVDGIIGFHIGDTYYYYQKNLQGDVVELIRYVPSHDDKQLVATYVYDAWGNHKVLNPDGTENTDSSFIGNKNPIRYRSYYYDVETGLYYLKTRYYDPRVCRFISPDSTKYLETSELGGMNLYAYCGNNPVMGYDPDGSDWWDPIKEFCVEKRNIFGRGSTTLAILRGTMFLGFAVASIFDSQVRADMESIGWNPFNTNEDAVILSKKVSFYKGQPIIRGDFPGCLSFGVMLLDKGDWVTEDVLLHEHGHFKQLEILGVKKYAINIALPSLAGAITYSGDDKYYNSQPWEITADMFGGVKQEEYLKNSKRRGLMYFLIALFLN